MTNNRREIGKKYEKEASKYLVSNGYKIIEKNYYCKIGEIDIIAKDEDYLCFIEVKYRDKVSLASGLYAVDKDKQKTIYKVASLYMLDKKISDDTKCRFDVVSIDGDQITLIKNAFP